MAAEDNAGVQRAAMQNCFVWRAYGDLGKPRVYFGIIFRCFVQKSNKRVCVWLKRLEKPNKRDVFVAQIRQTRMCLPLNGKQTRMCVECVWNVCGMCVECVWYKYENKQTRMCLVSRQQTRMCLPVNLRKKTTNAYVFGNRIANAYVFGGATRIW